MNNDLISRSELKKAFEHLASDDYESPLWYESTVFRVIDNAPTVEPEKAKEGELVKAYTKGFDTGVETVKTERPQGKWITEDILHCLYYCSNCRNNGERIMPYCPWCGADMKGGEDHD